MGNPKPESQNQKDKSVSGTQAIDERSKGSDQRMFSHQQVPLKRENMLQNTLGGNPFSSINYSHLSSPMPNSTMDARATANRENAFSKIGKKAVVNNQSHNQVYEKYSQGSNSSKVASKANNQLSEDSSSQEQFKRLNIKLVNGNMISKSFKEDEIVASVLTNIFEKEAGMGKERELDKFSMYLKGAKLNLFTKISTLQLKKGDFLELRNDQSQEKKQKADEFADLSVIPKLNLPGYRTTPNYVKICRMTEGELSKIENFTIKNEWAEVRFLEPVNILGIDLDNTINFKHKSVEIYLEEADRPPVGRGLNKPAQITYFNFGFTENLPEDKIRRRIESWVARIGAQLISIDPKQDSVSIYVEHF